MVLPYPKGLIVIKKILHIVLVYLLWCFCIQYLVLNHLCPRGIETRSHSRENGRARRSWMMRLGERL
jgi:hypothetical protein